MASFVTAATDGRCARARRSARGAARDRRATHGRRSSWAAAGTAIPSAPGGPRGWAPILYVDPLRASPRPSSPATLLARGADPNATFTNEYGPMSAVYGAAGVRHDPELTRVLLEAGADPNDGESLYHAAEARRHRVPAPPPRARRPTRAGTNALGARHRLRPPRTRPPPPRRGRRRRTRAAAPPGARRAPRAAAPRCCCLLAARRPDLDRQGGGVVDAARPSTGPPYQNAVLRNRDDVAALLRNLGADSVGAPRTISRSPRSPAVSAPPAPLPADAGGRRPGGADPRCAPRPPGPRGRPRSDRVFGHVRRRPARHAAPPRVLGRRHREIVAPAARAGARIPCAPSGAEFDTPIAWAALGSEHHALPGRDYVRCGRAAARRRRPTRARASPTWLPDR